ncbi:phage major tail tube protein [Paenibacillus sp. 481]|uniref:phage major tail tube protein n=1 Tax=Paenibacillus sp. 481 TaxID=2835869 RepID=UPI001E596C6F|nr:phage major tail tube protein [Paenibacillus sp. 481]UHA74462.1 phage major tail tube protein [Paenibacillus sp. 481]
MTRQIAERVSQYTVYLNGSTFLGTSEVQLPSVESLTEAVKGAGIFGEVNSPTIGALASMTCTLNWRAIEPAAIRLAAPVAHALDFRASEQVFNPTTSSYDQVGIKASVRAIPKKFETGKLAVGATTDSLNEFEVIYYKLEVGGKVLLEIDKYNFKFIIDGVDYLAKMRSQLGL